MFFDELPLSDEVLDALWDMHFDVCTPVQEQTIPIILEGRDVISCAQTGTGKTAAYILPLLTNLQFDRHDPNKLNAIIMAPTRELAQQIDQQMEGFGYYVPFSSVPVYGGNDSRNFSTQANGLKTGADIVIATPGRLLSHMNIMDIDFSGVKYFILDEADRMLDMGFYDDIMKIVDCLPRDRQTIMFSATMPENIRRMARKIMTNPAEVKIAISRPPESIAQRALCCYEAQKIPFIIDRLKEAGLRKVILFAGKKQCVKELTVLLSRQGLNARAMHSDLEQKQRDEVMLDFRNNKVDVLVATDIVARGIDVDDIPLVINFDVPRDAEDYVHRIGRTARAENRGEAITLVSPEDARYWSKIERFLQRDIQRLTLPSALGDAPDNSLYAQPERGAHKHSSAHRSSRGKHSNNGRQHSSRHGRRGANKS